MSKPQPLFKPSAATIAASELFNAADVGQTITDDEIRKAIVFEIDDSRLYGTCRRITNRMLRDQIVFERIPRTGWVRLNSVESVGSAARHTRRIQREAQRGIAKLISARDEELDPSTAAKKAVRLTVLSVVSGCFDIKVQKRLPDNGVIPDKPLSLLEMVQKIQHK